jgi:tRNA (cmo5U34)-methyltransferase
MQSTHSTFTDRSAVANYATSTPRKVPGLHDLHRMTELLLSEQATGAGQVLVVGAGGGLELVSMAAARPEWQFVGVDPSPAMLDLARLAAAPFAKRVQWVEGPGARLVLAHHSPPAGHTERWMTRSAAFATGTSASEARAVVSGKQMAEQLSLINPDEEEELLRAAGYTDVEQFYAALSFRGWVATAQ